MNRFIEKFRSERSVFFKIGILILLYFGANVYFAFATDTYATFSGGFLSSAIDMTTRNGRPIIGFIYLLHSLSGLSNESFYTISSALALVFLAAAVWLYQRILAKYQLGENTRILLSFVAIANIFIIEYFMFIEKCGFMLAVLLNIAAVYCAESFFASKRFPYLIALQAFLILVILTYPGTIALFVILSIPFALNHSKNLKAYIQNLFCIGLSYVFSVSVDLLAFKFIFKSSRISYSNDLVSNIETVIRGAIEYAISTFDILPRFLFLTLTAFLFAAVVISAFSHKNKFLYILNAFVISFAALVFSTATILQGSGWWSTRTTYPIASVAGAFAVQLFLSFPSIPAQCQKARLAQRLSLLAIVILLVCQYFSFNKIYIDKYKLNALDAYRCHYIGQAIQDHQEVTGETIKRIAFYKDHTPTYSYPDLYAQGDLIVSALTMEWSDLLSINYYLGTSYEKAVPSDSYIEYFASKDWDQLSQNQFIFDGDTLHLCIY
ncbi:MAG: glucosyltransferase domain-containing protein [Agathobaculum sp.]|uniref:glucosyltransferase domain-containing protein n=1 Tax=Agathobaculum sp. TaxID=2048138 RepID=UPI0025BA5691|nr:glucosyltransferase domain-containing protein [Agathobaculum sp.]MCI7125987.1 glucosyltransferase domain-containing protein [Agathobaculum sp.]